MLAGFVAKLDETNALAESSEGFVWRLVTGEDDNLAESPFGSNIIVNMSVWESIETLHNFVYRSSHAGVMARRKQWFEHMDEQYSVLWWLPKGHRPTELEAMDKLNLLNKRGPCAEAFTFKHAFEPPVS